MTKVSNEQLFALIEKLKAENEALKAKGGRANTPTVKLGEKGNILIYGLQRFPFAFYAAQLEWILANADALRKFMKDNADKLSRK